MKMELFANKSMKAKWRTLTKRELTNISGRHQRSDKEKKGWLATLASKRNGRG